MGESKKFPLSQERKTALGGQRTIATFVSPQPDTTSHIIANIAPVAPTAYAPPTQAMPPLPPSSSDNDVPLLSLLKKRKTPPTQEAEEVPSDTTTFNDDCKPAAVVAATTTKHTVFMEAASSRGRSMARCVKSS